MSKKTVFKIILFASLFLFRGEVFSQDISSLVIFGFDVSGVLTADDGRAMSRRIFDEINSWGVLSLFEESQAESADYIIRGKLSQSRRGYSLSAETFNRETEENLVSVTEEASSIEELYQNIFDFCIKITQPIPFPNYLVGTWEASIPVEGSPLLCRLVFKTDRSVIVERYDTCEYQTSSVLKYEGIGSGHYTFFSRVERGSSANALLTISLDLEDALPAYTSINLSRIPLVFNSEARTAFELSSSGFPCGENNGGASVYPQKNMFYTQFVKID